MILLSANNKSEAELCGEILSKYIDVERAMNWLISIHYFDTINEDFISNILFYTRGRNKIDAFKELYGDTNAFQLIKRDIYRLNEIRNVFAHGQKFTHFDVSTNTKTRLISKRMRIDTEKLSNYEIQPIYEEFMKTAARVNDILWGLIPQTKND